ncbi:MAG: hypothetical protein LBL45_07145 [Treponema sp.]|nr:hypothetical protein [Treponema sp.]
MDMGIHPQDATPTHHAPPESQPDIVVENTSNHFEHRLRTLNHEIGAASKPADAYGMRYAWQVGSEKSASGEFLPKSKFTWRAIHIVTPTEADKGKTAYYAVCYENSKGDMGPWPPIAEVVIG